MIPLRDDIPARTTPVVNYTMIGICAIVFLIQLGDGRDEAVLVEEYGMIPARITDPGKPVEIPHRYAEQTPHGVEIREVSRPAAPSAVPPLLTLLTCIFLHGGWMHFLGNVWFLHIFGDNVEDRMGHVGYLIFYLASGVAASLSHLLSAPGSTIPTIGASGAIAGVMGAYMLLYPRSMVLTLIPIFIIFYTVVIPAPIFLGIWFLLQLFQGTVQIANIQVTGVAWWAHIGGFVVGAAVAWVLERTHHVNPPVERRLPYSHHMTRYHIHRDDPRW